MKLVEIFKEHEPIVNGRSFMGKYRAKYKIVPRRHRNFLTVEDLEKYVKRLQERYPNRDFYLRKTKYKGKVYYVITRKSYKKMPDGTRKWVKDRIPIYFDLEKQRYYVPESYIKRTPRLANYLIMVTLGALGISQSKYLGLKEV